MVRISILKSLIKEVAMKVNLTLSVEDALRLQRVLFDCRHAMSVNAGSMRWVFLGNPDVSFDIADIILMEDVQCDLIAAIDEEADRVHFAGNCKVF